MTEVISVDTKLESSPILGDLGKIAIRVVVLPRKMDVKGKLISNETEPLDLDDDELLPDKSATPLSSYLESSKGGKQCVVFLVNGQRQDSLDNSFIIEQLGFKYLRRQMMIIVDVDSLKPEALGRLTQGSRQGFYRGDVWDAITKRIVATLKDDPDLVRLEEEEEEKVSELKAGNEKVKHTLDQLIDSHNQQGLHFAEGAGIQGDDESKENLGMKTVTRNGVVSLLPPGEGTPADYPVLISQPSSASIRLWPDKDREVSIKSMPSNAWPALAELAIESDPSVPELKVTQERVTNQIKLRLRFHQPANFDSDNYPIRANLRATANFNGITEPRRLVLKIFIKPDNPTPEPILNDPPTWLRVSSREPVKIKTGTSDTHVRLRWDGKDDLAMGPNPRWVFRAKIVGYSGAQPAMNFSEPKGGRLSLLVSPEPQWEAGNTLNFEVIASNAEGKSLSATFTAIVVETTTRPDPEEKVPRLVNAEVLAGSKRRPPYELKYVKRDEYDGGTCWGQVNWTDEDPGCFQEATERTPLILIINEDMAAIREYQRFLTKTFTESEVERRINKYTSHVAFHLYQMYQASQQETQGESEDIDQRRRAEIQRVASTLIKLMEVSR